MFTRLFGTPLSLGALAALAALLLAAEVPTAQAEYSFVSSFGRSGTALGQFGAPRGVTVNHRGDIVITESTNNRVQVCSYTGSCIGFGSFGTLSGEFDRPRGVAVNAVDRMFIADRGNDRIASCSRSGSCTDFGGSGVAVGKFESPRGIAIDPQDMIYITDTDHDRVQICNDQGVCTAFGSSGSGLGQFSSPAGIALDSSGQIVIADRGNDRIQICSAQGTNCKAFGTAGTGLGQFNGPAGVAVDNQDRIIVVDRFNDRIQVCSQQGSCTAFGSFGTGAGQFDIPWGVAVDTANRIIVADLGNDRIQIFAEPAVQITSFSASPATIMEGESTTLSWAVNNATSCTAVGGNGDWQAVSPSAAGGSVVINVATPGNYVFTLQCTDGTGTVSATANVVVTPILDMNVGLNDAWYYPTTNGQGFFITVYPDLGKVTLSWFTYDTQRPANGVTADLGEPGHRWLNAIGTISRNQAVMDVKITSGGVFDTATDVVTVKDGTILLTFDSCNSGTVEYDIPSINQAGIVPIQRVANDNITLCETLAAQAAVQQGNAKPAADAGSTPLSTGTPVTNAALLPLAEMNPGLNDAWYYPTTNGQGFFITVFPVLGKVTLSWFTYDTQRPVDGVTANLGEPGHRWLNAIGTISGNQAVMDIKVTSGGIFDTATDVVTVKDGTILLTFDTCNSGTVEYDIPSINQAGQVPIQRVANDNIALCESLIP